MPARPSRAWRNSALVVLAVRRMVRRSAASGCSTTVTSIGRSSSRSRASARAGAPGGGRSGGRSAVRRRSSVVGRPAPGAGGEARAYAGRVTVQHLDRPLAVPALVEATASESALRRFLHGLPGVDQVGAEARVADLGTRSIKKQSKLFALDLAIRMTDLTTLEGADTPGKVRAMCAKALQPDPGDPDRPAGRRRLRLPRHGAGRRGGPGRLRAPHRQRGHRLPQRPGAHGGQAGRRPLRRRRRRRRDRHGDRPRRLPRRALRGGVRGDPDGEGGVRLRPPQGDPGDGRAGDARQRPAGLVARPAGRRRLHQDVDRQGATRRRRCRSRW